MSRMSRWQIPGAGLAVVKDGRLVLAHAYGLADREAAELVQPTSLFRLASV
jgi:CubicO group peptidase (beta-lactamase class C family)